MKAPGGDAPRAHEDQLAEPSETTSLLGAQAPTSADSQYGRDGADTAETEPVWDGYKDFEGLPWWRYPSVFWLLGPFIIFTLAFGGVMVPRLNLVLSLVCKQYFADRSIHDPKQPVVPVFVGGDNPQCNIPEVQSRVATFTLAMNFITGLLSALVAPQMGRLSDRYGRTQLMALASTGGVMGEIITVLVARFPNHIDYRWMILSSIFDGATGSFTAGGILTQSYTSDCTPPSKRAVYIGYTHACLFTGLALGPLLAGYFVKWTGNLLTVFYVIVACHTAYIFLLSLVVPESLSKRRRVAARERWAKEKLQRSQSMGRWLSRIQKVNPFEPLTILWPTEPGTTTRLRINVVGLAVIDTILQGASLAVGPVLILYSEYMFDWGTLESSQFVSAFSFLRVGILMGLFPLINFLARTLPARRRLRETGVAPKERNAGADRVDIWVLRVALLSEVVGCVSYVFSRSGRAFFASGMVTSLGGLGSATIQASVTKHVPPQRVGQVVGAIGMLHALSRVVGPIVFNGLYSATVGSYPQAFLVLLGGLFGVALLTSLILKPGVFWENHDEDETEPLHPGRVSNVDRALPIEDDPLIIT